MKEIKNPGCLIITSNLYKIFMVYCLLVSNKWQHCAADATYPPPHFKQWEKRAMTNVRHLFTFEKCWAVTANRAVNGDI